MNTRSKFITAGLALAIWTSLSTTSLVQAQSPAPMKVIFDTDFRIPPQDDGLALALAINSPELQILGVTTVAGNDTVQRATSDALRELEIAGRNDIPVYRGSNRPLVHAKPDSMTTYPGRWWSDEAPAMPPGGFAKTQAQAESAVSFIIRTINANPGQITIIAIGPLTNIAMAMRFEPGLAQKIKKIAIMGGAIGAVDGGGGNSMPNAEFNFWVDPEAAQDVIRSGVPISLTGLNVTRKTHFTKDWYDQIVAVDTPLTRLIKERMDPGYAANPNRSGQMYDELTVASLIDPTLVKAQQMYVDVDINHGPNYGVSVGSMKPFEGGENAKQISVQYDVDNERFMEMYVARVTKK